MVIPLQSSFMSLIAPILVIAGTNRPNANTLKVARAILGHYAKLNVAVELYSLGDLPAAAFEPTAYAQKPAAFVEVQQRVVASAGLHVVTPEYNGSFPGVLKYFIDLLKFPESFDRKPVAFTGLANGMWGGLRSVEQLQAIFGYRNAHIYPDRVFIPTVKDKLDPTGLITDPAIDTRLAVQAEGFATFVGKLKAA
jgi:chromate reductase